MDRMKFRKTRIMRVKKISSSKRVFKIKSFKKKFGMGGNPIRKRMVKTDESEKLTIFLFLMEKINFKTAPM